MRMRTRRQNIDGDGELTHEGMRNKGVASQRNVSFQAKSKEVERNANQHALKLHNTTVSA